jgi:hypothetical protein
MTQPSLLDVPPSRVADVSREGFARISPTLTKREIVVFNALCAYLASRWDGPGVTGGELTRWMMAHGTATDVNDVRPRLTGLHQKGWITRHAIRPCRVKGTSAHPYTPAVPRSAVERIK